MTQDQKLIHRLARTKDGLAGVKHLLTNDNLRVRSRDRRETAFHLAAASGGIFHIPKELLTAENLTAERFNLDTPLHLAGWHGTIGMISDLAPKVLTEHNLRLQSSMGSVFHDAALGGVLRHLPKDLLTVDNLAYLWGRNRDSVLHCITAADDFRQLPDELLQTEHFMATGRDGATVFHTAAASGSIVGIPQRLLTKEAIFATDDAGYTPLLHATRNGSVTHFPEAIMKEHYHELIQVVRRFYQYNQKEEPRLVGGYLVNVAQWIGGLSQAVLAEAHGKRNSCIRRP